MENAEFRRLIARYGKDILSSPGMQAEKGFIQHGSISVYEHSIHVVYCSLALAAIFRLRVDQKAIVRGGLLHDYFLYDWHIPSPTHRLHGFRHANCALRNAAGEFSLTPIEQDIIARHMFPLNIKPPKYRESIFVCIADKCCAICEIFAGNWTRQKMKSSLFSPSVSILSKFPAKPKP